MAGGDTANGTKGGKDEKSGPSFLERRRAAWPWFDHVMRAVKRYQEQRGDHYAAGITYFTVLALFPLLMVAFAAAGFVLAGNADLLADLKTQITDNVPGSMGTTISDLVDTAIKSRATVGIIGILGALYTGLGWMAHLRAALTEQWEQVSTPPNFIMKKLHDLGALIGLAAAFVVSLGVSALGSGSIGRKVLGWLHLDTMPGADLLLTVVSIIVGVAASWALFIWIIAWMPRERVALHSALRGALLAAIVFEIFKRVAVIYLEKVMSGPAGATFGPIIGIMVFAYITARITLFATAFAATSEESMALAPVPVPDQAVIRPQVQVHEGGRTATALVAAGAGVAAVVGLGRFGRDRRR